MPNIPALTIRQPWASAIIQGIKTVENRSWGTRYRGPIAVIAGISTRDLQAGSRKLAGLGYKIQTLPRGVLLGVVTLNKIIPVSLIDNPFATGPLCWILENPRQLPHPIPFTGFLGLRSINLPVQIAALL